MVDRKMSLKELAENVGISYVNLSKIKTGKVQGIRFSTLESICETLGCQPGDILEFVPGEHLCDACDDGFSGEAAEHDRHTRHRGSGEHARRLLRSIRSPWPSGTWAARPTRTSGPCPHPFSVPCRCISHGPPIWTPCSFSRCPWGVSPERRGALRPRPPTGSPTFSLRERGVHNEGHTGIWG